MDGFPPQGQSQYRLLGSSEQWAVAFPTRHDSAHFPSQVAQAELGNVHVLDAQIERLRRTRDRIAESILRRMLSGAQVEAGTFDAEIEEHVIDGVLCQNVGVI